MSVTTPTDLWRMGATELARVISSKQASSQEVIEAHLRRIEEVNQSINAVVIVLGEQALDAAKAADRAVSSGGDLGPFHGVPFTVKENIDVAGTPTTQGLKALANAYPRRDAPVVERLKGVGAIPIGRTNVPSGAIRWHCESELWGATVNPWDPSRTPGASSAGEAAAIATGMSPLGLGNDGLGSAPASRPMLRCRRAEAHAGTHPACDVGRARGHGDHRCATDGCQRPAGAACCGPPSRLRGAGRA